MTIVQADSVRSTVTQRVIEFRVPGEDRGYCRHIRTASNRRYLVMARHGGYTEMRTDNVVTARKRAEKVGGFVVDTLVPSNRVQVSAHSRSYPAGTTYRQAGIPIDRAGNHTPFCRNEQPDPDCNCDACDRYFRTHQPEKPNRPAYGFGE